MISRRCAMTRVLALIVALTIPAAIWANDAPDAPERAIFVTLGTGGGPVTRLKRSQPANAVVIGKDVYLFDVGDGVMRQMLGARLMVPNIKAIFISHHHIDHNADLGPVLVSRWLFNGAGKVPVIGPPGTVAMVKGIGATFAAMEVASATLGNVPKTRIAASATATDLALTMDVPTLVYQDAHIRVLAITNDHYHNRPGSVVGKTTRSYSYRIEAGGRSFVFTGDTGPSRHLEQLAKGADMLITEVVNIDAARMALEKMGNLPAQAIAPIMGHMAEDHLTPDAIGQLAQAAGVKEVILTHLAPGMDFEPSTDGYVKGIAMHFKGPVRVANDLDRF